MVIGAARAANPGTITQSLFTNHLFANHLFANPISQFNGQIPFRLFLPELRLRIREMAG